MDTLRVILIIFGILLVAGIYLADRVNAKRQRTMRRPEEVDPDMLGESFAAVEDSLPFEAFDKTESISARRNQPLADETLDGLKGINGSDSVIPEAAIVSSRQDASGSQRESVIVLTVMAREGQRFSGPLLLKVLQEVGLTHGELGIFHYHFPGNKGALFSVANILEPGRFVLSEIATLETPGLAVFMQLPAVVPGELALKTLLQKSRQIAAQLSGSLCDEERLPLSEEKLARLEHRAKLYTAS